MLPEIERFVNWVRRRNPNAHTWRDYRADLKQFVAVVGNRPPGAVTFHDIDRFVAQQVASQNASVCPAPFRKRTCTGSSPPSTTAVIWLCFS